MLSGKPNLSGCAVAKVSAADALPSPAGGKIGAPRKRRSTICGHIMADGPTRNAAAEYPMMFTFCVSLVDSQLRTDQSSAISVSLSDSHRLYRYGSSTSGGPAVPLG